MNNESSSNLFMGSFLTSFFGGILLLLEDFAVWYNYDYL